MLGRPAGPRGHHGLQMLALRGGEGEGVRHVAEQQVRDLARADLAGRLAGQAAAVAHEHLGPEPRGVLVGRYHVGGQRALQEIVHRRRAIGGGEDRQRRGALGGQPPHPGPRHRQVRDGVHRHGLVGFLVTAGQRRLQAAPRLGQADLLGPIERVVLAVHGLDQAGRVGGHADRDRDRNAGQVDLPHDAVLRLAVAERHRDRLVVAEHVVPPPGPVRNRLPDPGHPVRRVGAGLGQPGQPLAGRPLGGRRAQRHQQPEHRGPLRRGLADRLLDQHLVDKGLRVVGSQPPHPRQRHARRRLEFGAQRVARGDRPPEAPHHPLDERAGILTPRGAGGGRSGGVAWSSCSPAPSYGAATTIRPREPPRPRRRRR